MPGSPGRADWEENLCFARLSEEVEKGIETPKRDVDLIKKRYAEAQELAHEHEKTKTN
jgi:hypothetical protein